MKDKSNLKILYMGTPAMSASLLEHLILSGYQVVAIISQEDAIVGRKKILTPSPVKEVGLKYNIPVYTPHKIRLDYEFVKEIDFDLLLTFAYGQIVPVGLLELAPLGAYNVHGSILPSYRGAAPIQRAIMDGLNRTGLTLMRMVDKMDAGGMFAKTYVDILPSDNYGSLCEKLALSANELIDNNLIALANGELEEVFQDESLVTIAKKIKPEDELLPLESKNTHELFNHIRALAPTPGSYIYYQNKKLKIFAASITSYLFEVGTLRKAHGHLYLGCQDGALELKLVQPEGKGVMEAKAFLNGHQEILDL